VSEAWLLKNNTVGVSLGTSQVSFEALVECLTGFQGLGGEMCIQSATLTVATRAPLAHLTAMSQPPHRPWTLWNWWLLLSLGAGFLWAAASMAPFVDRAAGPLPVLVPGLDQVLHTLLLNFVSALER
jgi:hypothetical protein